jgi:BolA family transcriptional regulator, general stress-responsive regulator
MGSGGFHGKRDTDSPTACRLDATALARQVIRDGNHPEHTPTMTTAERIHDALATGLAPAAIDVRDESARHAGHAGARPEGETHFRVRVVTEVFREKSRIERHRMVHKLLENELSGGVHALRIQAMTPEEAAAKQDCIL